MHDVETQLREYFDASVERITAEDVVAGHLVTGQIHDRRHRRAPRPLVAAAVSFATTLLVLGGSLGLGLALRQPGREAGSDSISDRVGEAFATSAWVWLLLPLVPALLGAALVLLIRVRTTKRKETAMATTIETSPSERMGTHERKTRRLVIAVTVLTVALVALATWIVIDRAGSSSALATPEIADAYDAYTASWMADGDAEFLAMTTQNFTFISSGRVFTRAEQAATIASTGDFQVERIGDLIMTGDNPYYLTTASRVTYAGQESEGISSVSIVETPDGLKVTRHYWLGDL